jgi:hypothetical protein
LILNEPPLYNLVSNCAVIHANGEFARDVVLEVWRLATGCFGQRLDVT